MPQAKPSLNVFEVQHAPDHTTLRLFGQVDAAVVQKIRPAIQDALPPGCARLVVDLSKLEFLDSHGVGLFVSLLKTVHANDGRLILAGAFGQPSSVLRMVGFNGDLVTWCDSAESVPAA